MDQEVEQLRTLVGDLFSRIERLEERVDELEEGAVSQPKGPEPLLTCVHCLAEYKESENGDGYCKYHTGTIQYGFNVKLTCCNKGTGQTAEDLLQYAGCAKGKHRSKHHTEFFYTNYLIFMRGLSNNAKEMWSEMDIYDCIIESCLWAEVGKSNENDIFVLAGSKCNTPSVCASLKPQEIKKCKKSYVLFEMSDSAGWCLKAELVMEGSKAEGILVTLKTAWSKTPYAKKVQFAYEGEDITVGSVESLSDPTPQKPSLNYAVPEESHTGPVLEAGEDYSQGRKNDYPTVTNDDLFPMEMVQLGTSIEVNADTWGMKDGQWTNFFDATIKVTNGSLDIVNLADVLGEYQNADGEWVSCAKIRARLKDSKNWDENLNFQVDGAAPLALVVRLEITINGGPVPGDNQERKRAHHSLPQPLKLRITLVDDQKRNASLIVEQGNKPLPLATVEKRQERWSKKKPLLFHLFADDVDLRKRSDVALYYNEDLSIIYRPSSNDSGNTYYTLRANMFEIAAYKAKKSGEKEQELTALRSENKGSKIEVFAVVDLEYQFTFALKIVISTPTSGATGYFLLPSSDEIYQATLSASAEVEVKGDLTVEWKVPFASKNDKIAIYNCLGCSSISSQYNRKEETEGSLKMKAPGAPGVYEVRYYPRKLQSNNTPFTHDIFVASAQFSVITA